MPTYVYVCDVGCCTEVRQPMSADSLTVCPNEGCTAAARRRLSAAGVVLKGSGFYRNDARKGV